MEDEYRSLWGLVRELGFHNDDVETVRRYIERELQDTDKTLPEILSASESYDGSSALHLTAMHDIPNVCRLLCSYGADLHAVDYNRDTAMHYAAHYGCLHVAKVLAWEFEADLTLENGEGETVHDLASQAEGNLEQMVKLLRDEIPHARRNECITWLVLIARNTLTIRLPERIDHQILDLLIDRVLKIAGLKSRYLVQFCH